LKSQISSLEEQVTDKNTKVDELKTEKIAIQKNIKSIEKMKNDINNPTSKS
jgi:predicted  nucleic acid-binding Zn-ribbon protein